MSHTELYLRHRPTKLDQVIGQDDAVKVLKKYLQNGGLPHAILMHGPSGVGKTTLARILAREVGCPDRHLSEINCAVVEAMDTIRQISEQAQFGPLGGKARAWILDEFQSFSRASFSQQAMLKVLEDGRNDSSYFFIVTTDPSKIIPAVKNRCTTLPLRPVPPEELIGLVRGVAGKEKANIGTGVANRIAALADGSPRRALVLLESVIGLSDGKEQLAALEDKSTRKAAFDLVKALMPFKGRPNWNEIVAVLKSVEDKEPEGIRQLILKCARTTILKGGVPAARASAIIQMFRDPLYDRGSGHAILASLCWEMLK